MSNCAILRYSNTKTDKFLLFAFYSHKLPDQAKAIPDMLRGHSVKILLHEPGEFPQLDKGFYIPAGFAAFVSIKKKKVNKGKLLIMVLS